MTEQELLTEKAFYKHLRLRFLVQRCSHAEVFIAGNSQGKLSPALMVFFGVGVVEKSFFSLMPTEQIINDCEKHFKPILQRCAEKLVGLRIFADAQDKMNLNVQEALGGIYLVSQFTLFADNKKGLRPSFARSAPPVIGELFFKELQEYFKRQYSGLPFCCGEFAANMQVSLVNNGPVTILIEADHEGFL